VMKTRGLNNDSYIINGEEFPIDERTDELLTAFERKHLTVPEINFIQKECRR